MDNRKVETVVDIENSDPVTTKRLKKPETWLRVYPARKVDNEPVTATCFRIIACQIGLFVLLILWMLMCCYIITYFEDPYEDDISDNYRQRNLELVVNLALQIQKIDPNTERWKEAVRNETAELERLTNDAIKAGARLDLGKFWNFAGTILFAFNIITVLGCGTPLPKTIPGRICAVVYALVATPVNMTLLVQSTKCLSTRAGNYFRRTFFPGSVPVEAKRNFIQRSKDKVCKYIKRLWLFQGIPLLTILYYMLGMLGFGTMRGKDFTDSFLFPMDFTATGGLQLIPGSLKFIYALFLEGLLFLLILMLIVIRRKFKRFLKRLRERFRLTQVEK